MLLVFTRVLALTVVACRGQQQLTCFEPGQCNAVPDTFTSTNSANECLDYCKQDQDCQWFSWFSDTVCISYTSCPSLNSDCGGGNTCVSGEKLCPPEGQAQCHVLGQCEAIPIGNALTNSYEECLTDHCQPNPGCKWFTFDSASKVCLLFSECESLDTSCDTCSSGERNCSTNGDQCWIPGQCQAVPIGTEGGVSANECLGLCQGDDQCQWLTFDPLSSVCLLFDLCDDVDESSCPSCLTAAQDCPPLDSSSSTTDGGGSSTDPPALELKNVMVLGGFAGQSLSDVEVFSFGSSTSCSNPEDLPVAVLELSAALVNGQLVVSGGKEAETNEIKATSFVFEDGSWQPMGNLKEARYQHASVVTPTGLWVLGGQGMSGKLDTIEVLEGETWTTSSSVRLPAPLLGHCAVDIGSGKILLAGGSTNDEPFSAATYIYDPTSGWTEVDTMVTPRLQHGCVKIGNSVFTAGGTGSSGALAQAEVFDLASKTWTALASLPFGVQAPDLVAIDNEPVVIGGLGGPDGYSKAFVRLTSSSWEIDPSVELATPRYEHVAVAVSDEVLVNCR